MKSTGSDIFLPCCDTTVFGRCNRTLFFSEADRFSIDELDDVAIEIFDCSIEDSAFTIAVAGCTAWVGSGA